MHAGWGSESDAEHLEAAVNIRTVANRGSDKFFLWVQALATLADRPPSGLGAVITMVHHTGLVGSGAALPV
ncbi:hypothetical protein [Rhodococcus sp. USK13]|uniref:hypothetical protein n=1 Tax=Rhodococcus sp. USK13 TaxID=2806442 RepID=UPI001BCB17BC|nr:hypothetical protein [Rhodococcus sp. USK13]